MKNKGYRIETTYHPQPLVHGDESRGMYWERVKLLLPEPGGNIDKVLFIMGLEDALDDKWLTGPYLAFGRRSDMAILCGEHRGYGESVTRGDQSVPDYISIKEALADYHELRREFGPRFPGKWLLYGCSYGGGLVISYAHAYPDDAKAMICSSGVVDWNPLLPEYDEAARENLGPELYERLCVHVDNLTPAEPFSKNWLGREKIYAFVTGLCQFREYQPLMPVVNAMAKLPTPAFVAAMDAADVLFAGKSASDYAESNRALTLTQEQMKKRRFAWRVWRYQQAFMTGTYWAPSAPRSIYRRSEAHWIRESELLFGKRATVFEKGTGWNVRDMVPELKIPMVYVRGGRDPWRRVGLEPDYPLQNGVILNIEDGYHGPERYPDVGPMVMAEALKYLKED